MGYLFRPWVEPLSREELIQKINTYKAEGSPERARPYAKRLALMDTGPLGRVTQPLGRATDDQTGRAPRKVLGIYRTGYR